MANSSSRYLSSKNTQYDYEKFPMRHLLAADQLGRRIDKFGQKTAQSGPLKGSIVVQFAFGRHSIKVAPSNQRR